MTEPYTIAITVAYDGSGFAGFARQPGLQTVQGRLEDALRTVLRSEVLTTGAGRTDAGVHALGQVVSLPVDEDIDVHQLLRSLNALTGEGIVVRQIRRARSGFSARFDAIEREYRYRIVRGAVPPLFLAPYAWHVAAPLDVTAMEDGARRLVGEHDFRSFCVTESGRDRRTVRRVNAIELIDEAHLGEQCLTIKVTGNAFLHSMVRVIVGTLVEVGVGRRGAQWVSEALSARARAAAGPTAPAHGLTFWGVSYPDEVWLDG